MTERHVIELINRYGGGSSIAIPPKNPLIAHNCIYSGMSSTKSFGRVSKGIEQESLIKHLKACELFFGDSFVMETDEETNQLTSLKVYGETVYGPNEYGGYEFGSWMNWRTDTNTQGRMMTKVDEFGRITDMYEGVWYPKTTILNGGVLGIFSSDVGAFQDVPSFLLFGPDIMPRIKELEQVKQYFGDMIVKWGENTFRLFAAGHAFYVVEKENLPFGDNALFFFCLERKRNSAPLNARGVVTYFSEDQSTFTSYRIGAPSESAPTDPENPENPDENEITEKE